MEDITRERRALGGPRAALAGSLPPPPDITIRARKPLPKLHSAVLGYSGNWMAMAARLRAMDTEKHTAKHRRMPCDARDRAKLEERMKRRAALLFVAQFAAGLFCMGAVLAQPAPLPPPPEHPPLEPVAMEILKAAAGQLAQAGAMSFTAVATFQQPARNGQPIYYTDLYEVVMRRPDKLRVIMPGDGPASEFYYDGKVMAAYAPALDLIAFADAPPTMDETLKAAEDKAAIFFPFEDVLKSDPYKALSDGLKTAFYIGQSKYVGGTVTDMVAVANDDVQAQLWIGVDDGLLREMRVSFPKDPMRASYDVQFSNWKLNGLVDNAEFSTPHVATSPRMAFSRPDAPAPGAK